MFFLGTANLEAQKANGALPPNVPRGSGQCRGNHSSTKAIFLGLEKFGPQFFIFIVFITTLQCAMTLGWVSYMFLCLRYFAVSIFIFYVRISISVGAGKFLGMRKIFGQIFPNVPEKSLGHFLCEDLMKTLFRMISNKRSSCEFARHLFQIKHTLGAIFASIFSNFPQIFRDFKNVVTDFAHIFTDLAQISKSKRLRVCLQTLHPRLLHHCVFLLPFVAQCAKL